MMPQHLPPGYRPGMVWAKKNKDGSVKPLCHCNCHEGKRRPIAAEAMLCTPCADDAFTPWLDTLERIL